MKPIWSILLMVLGLCMIGSLLFYLEYDSMKAAHEFCEKKGYGKAEDMKVLSRDVVGVECEEVGLIKTTWGKVCTNFNKWGECTKRRFYIHNNNLAGDWQ